MIFGELVGDGVSREGQEKRLKGWIQDNLSVFCIKPDQQMIAAYHKDEKFKTVNQRC